MNPRRRPVKLTSKDMEKMRRLYVNGSTLIFLAKRFGMSVSTAWHIKERNRWKRLDLG